MNIIPVLKYKAGKIMIVSGYEDCFEELNIFHDKEGISRIQGFVFFKDQQIIVFKEIKKEDLNCFNIIKDVEIVYNGKYDLESFKISILEAKNSITPNFNKTRQPVKVVQVHKT